jgi:YHS domain-containing protein
MAKDPVCGMNVDEKKVLLCSASCKSQFDNKPGKYGE